MTDDELRTAILDELEAIRTQGAGGKPLHLSDVNLAQRLRCDFEQLRPALEKLIEDGLVHGKARTLRVGEAHMEWDYLRLKVDPLPEPDPRDLD